MEASHPRPVSRGPLLHTRAVRAIPSQAVRQPRVLQRATGAPRPHLVPVSFLSCFVEKIFSFFFRLDVHFFPSFNRSANSCAVTLTSPLNGAVSPTTGFTSSVSSYTCNAGYTLSGSATTTCQASGSWSTAAPTCTGTHFNYIYNLVSFPSLHYLLKPIHAL